MLTQSYSRSLERLLEQFVQEWRSSVAVNLKGSTARAAESHLRAHILPKLGSLPLMEMSTKKVQSFVAYLATGSRSRKTVENVLLTLSSILRVAKSWDYACGSFTLTDITMPREGVRQEQRCFTDEEVGKIIDAAQNRPAPSRLSLRFLVYASVKFSRFASVT